MSIQGLYFVEIRRYPGSQGFMFDISEDRNEPARTETVETEEQLKELLSTFTPKNLTREEIMRQIMLPPCPGEKASKVQFCAIDTIAASEWPTR